MTKTFKVYQATATEDKELVFKVQEAKNQEAALEQMLDSCGGFLVTMETDTHEVIVGHAKWGKNSFSLGTIAKTDRIKGKAQAAITLDRLPLEGSIPEKQESDYAPVKKQIAQLKEQPKFNKDGSPRKRQGRPPVVKKPETPRLYRAYHDERGILVFTYLEYPDLEAARAAAHQDETAFVLVNIEQGTNIMRVRGTFNKVFKFFGPNAVVTDAILHETAVKVIGNRPVKDDEKKMNTETPVKETGTSEATSEGKKDDALDASMFYLQHKPHTNEPEPSPAELPKLPKVELPNQPQHADQIYDAIIDNQHALTKLMIEHVELQGSLKSLDTIVSEQDKQREMLEIRMNEVMAGRDKAEVNAAAKREELKKVSRKIADLLGGATDATS
jgi:hypothetical protein